MITFLKYSNEMPNFFPSPGNYLEDILKVEYTSEIPIDNKETTAQDNYFQARTGDFDVVIDFALYDGITSGLLGVSARAFFEEKSKKILVAIEYGSNKRAGFIDRKTMDFDYTYNKRNDNLRFTCQGVMGELIKYLSTKSLPNYSNTATQQITFNRFLITDLLESLSQTRLNINNQLNPVTKFEGQVYLSTPLYNDVKGRVTSLTRLNKWVFFKHIAYTFGIKYDLECDFVSPSLNGVITFRLNLTWRTNASTVRNLTITDHRKGFKLPEQKEWLMVRDREYIYTISTGDFKIDLTCASGILYNKDIMYDDNAGYADIEHMFILRRLITRISTNEIVEDLDGSVWRVIAGSGGLQLTGIVDAVKVTFHPLMDDDVRFSVGSFPPLIAAGVLLLARLFVKNFTYTSGSPPFFIRSYVDSVEHILQNTVKPEYKFMLNSGEKETKTMIYDFPKDAEINLYDTFEYGDSSFSVERIRLNPSKEEIEADLIEN